MQHAREASVRQCPANGFLAVFFQFGNTSASCLCPETDEMIAADCRTLVCAELPDGGLGDPTA